MTNPELADLVEPDDETALANHVHDIVASSETLADFIAAVNQCSPAVSFKVSRKQMEVFHLHLVKLPALVRALYEANQKLKEELSRFKKED